MIYYMSYEDLNLNLYVNRFILNTEFFNAFNVIIEMYSDKIRVIYVRSFIVESIAKLYRSFTLDKMFKKV